MKWQPRFDLLEGNDAETRSTKAISFVKLRSEKWRSRDLSKSFRECKEEYGMVGESIHSVGPFQEMAGHSLDQTIGNANLKQR
jgi:hypothetical protein